MEQSFDPQRFRQALGTFTTGVTIVTAVDANGADIGMTANSFNSASLSPPMVLWSLGRSSTNFDAFLSAKHFAVHILATDQDALAARFSQRGIDRFAGLRLERGPEGIPLLEGASARFECRTAFQYEGGDHVIFVGEVLRFDHCEREPLVFKRGRFALAVGKPASVPSASLMQPATPGAFDQDFLVYLLGRAYHQLFAKINRELMRRELDDAQYFALSLLGVRDGLTAAELDAMVAYTGTRISEHVVQRLQQLGFVDMDPASTPANRIHLTEVGRRTVVELLAVAQAASAQGEQSLDPSESSALRHLLTRVIESTDPGIPHPWQPRQP